MTALSAAVAEAVDAVRAHFADVPVEVIPDGAGGADVIVEQVDVGSTYDPSVTWLGFHINAAYPASDVYPHYAGRLSRADGQALGEAITLTTWHDRLAIQISRSSKQWNPAIDNAALKAEKVLLWLASR